MSRSARLLDLIQVLRRHRRPVTAMALAAELGVSPRTVYRDVATLLGQGVPVAGEAGVGYVLQPGFTLAPLMFTVDEVEALVLGLRWAEGRGDAGISLAAANARAKIAAVLPPDARDAAARVGLLVGDSAEIGAGSLATLRGAIRAERRVRIGYADADSVRTDRVVWPVALAFFDQVRVMVAWCELRRDFRHFRTDRIADAEPLAGRYPRRRAVLLTEWRAREGVPEPL